MYIFFILGKFGIIWFSEYYHFQVLRKSFELWYGTTLSHEKKFQIFFSFSYTSDQGLGGKSIPLVRNLQRWLLYPPNPKDSKLLAYKNQVQFLHFNFPPPPQKRLIWHGHILHYKKNCGKGEGVGIVYNHKMRENSRNWERKNYLSKDPLCWNHYWEWKPIQVLPSIGNTIHLFH